ncbi:MAG: hypothetical protein HFG49_00010 [Lachnospiraceae bacterium]|nr:hypothetical protein [Lachnospiraceae bacterium]
MDQGKCEKRKGSRKKAASSFLALTMVFFLWIGWLSGPVLAQEGQFYIERLEKEQILTDGDFSFFGSRMGTQIYYWMKDDQTPLFCVQKKAQLTDGILGTEGPEPIGNCRYFTNEQYELASIILQCCGLRRGEKGMLTPGEYLAGQASIWGVQSDQWIGTEQLKAEMETLYGHVDNWHGLTSDQIIRQSREMVEKICQGIDSYYGDTSPYIPAFASKYEDKSPVHQAQWQEDGSCCVVFELADKNEAVKEFVYELPDGWSCKWEGDEVSFFCQEPKPGLISVTGKAPKDSLLEDAMPIGLIYIVGSAYTTLQHLASYLDVDVPWSCYFKISVPEKPEKGTWYLPETRYYRHQEDFKALYGAELEKADGDTGELLEGVEFQVLESFDSGQLNGTLLDGRQFEKWTGFKERCPREVTDHEGRIRHQDQKEYHFEKTYCSGHPEPEIVYEGSSEEMQNQLQREAWEAWEAQVEACSRICDYHSSDESGKDELERDRNLAYEQFIHLKYGYKFKETKALEGYFPQEGESEAVFCLPVQADLPKISKKPVYRMMIAAEMVGSEASRSNGKKREEEIRNHWKDNEEQQKASPSDGTRKTGKQLVPIWLTSLIEPLRHDLGDEADSIEFYQFCIKNYKPGPPKESTPEETKPEESTPEETRPEESTPEETRPEESTPEETRPEESRPEETKPEESTPEETRPEESTPEDVPATEPDKETNPIPPSPGPGGGGGGSRPPSSPAVPATAMITETILQKVNPPRSGWVTAAYTPSAILDENGIPLNAREGKQFLLPKTGQKGMGRKGWAGAAFIFGLLSVWQIRKRKGPKDSGQAVSAVSFFQICLITFLAVCFMALGAYPAEAAESEAVFYVPAEGEEAVVPQQQYIDEEGNEYRLSSCRLIETVKEEAEEKGRKICSYEGLEGKEQIPDRILASFWEDEKEQRGTGELEQTRVIETASYWDDSFLVPLTFYDYGAEFYDFQDDQIPKGEELAYLLENQHLILDEIGCRADRYQIETIIWDGETYDSQGVSCRNALAFGKKLLSDYTVEYEGTIYYPEIRESQWEVIYRPAVQEMVFETDPFVRPEPETEAVIERIVARPRPQEQKRNSPGVFWKNIRTLVIYSISLAVLLPAAAYLFLFLKKGKHKRKEEKMPGNSC